MGLVNEVRHEWSDKARILQRPAVKKCCKPGPTIPMCDKVLLRWSSSRAHCADMKHLDRCAHESHFPIFESH